MPQEPETVIFQKVVKIEDADGRAIREGSVLREINDGDRGVVVQIVRAGNFGPMFSSLGDLVISNRPGTSRVTNRYSQWRHIPHNEQTYEERLASLLCRPYFHDGHREVSKDDGQAIEGIMALLPDDVVDWDYGPIPNRLEDALRFLVAHLSRENS